MGQPIRISGFMNLDGYCATINEWITRATITHELSREEAAERICKALIGIDNAAALHMIDSCGTFIFDVKTGKIIGVPGTRTTEKQDGPPA